MSLGCPPTCACTLTGSQAPGPTSPCLPLLRFRTRLLEERDGSLVGEVLPAEQVQVDAAAADCGDTPADLRAALQAELARPFDLGEPPCMRLRLLRHGRERHTLAITMHHSAGDGWSLGPLMSDLSAAYAAAVQRGSKKAAAQWPPPPLPIQYADVAQWQADLLADATEVERLASFWRQRLRGCVSLLQLATDRPRPAQPAGTGAVLRHALGSDLVASLRQLAARLQASLSTVFLAAVQLLLLRMSGQDEVTVGLPTAARQQEETHALVGYLVNPLPIRCTPSEGATFADLARQAAADTTAALEHAALPLQQVVEVAGVPRLPGVNPLFQVRRPVLHAV